MAVPSNFRVTEIKAFVPAKDFELSKQFYREIGFTMASDGGGVAYFHFENASFLLQDFFVETLAKELHDAPVGRGRRSLVAAHQR